MTTKNPIPLNPLSITQAEQVDVTWSSRFTTSYPEVLALVIGVFESRLAALEAHFSEQIAIVQGRSIAYHLAELNPFTNARVLQGKRMSTSYKNRIFGVVCACLTATSAPALTCTHNDGHRSALFTFDETSASLEILLGDAVVATATFQCGPSACTYSQDLGARGGPLHHLLRYFEERSEVIYAVSHEDFPARSAIQIYPVVCKTP